MIEGIDVLPQPLLIGVHQEFDVITMRDRVTERDHVPEFLRRVDVQQRKRRPPWIECLQGKVKHHRGILADRVKHDRFGKARDRLSHDENGFCFETTKMKKRRVHRTPKWILLHNLSRCRWALNTRPWPEIFGKYEIGGE